MIVAVSKNNVIGDTHKPLLWDIPEDLRHFYKLTKGHVVVMGMKTFRTLPNGKLKHRVNIVLTTQPVSSLSADELYFISLNDLFSHVKQFTDKKIFVIGGSQVYSLLFPYCGTIHYTLVHEDVKGDVVFPYSMDSIGIETAKSEIYTSINKHTYQFYTYVKDTSWLRS